MNRTRRSAIQLNKTSSISYQKLRSELDEKNNLINKLNDVNSNKQGEIRSLIAQVKRTEHENEQLSQQIENQAYQINDITIKNANTMRFVAMASLIIGSFIGFYFARVML